MVRETLVWRGDWSREPAYRPGDVVQRDGDLYVCIRSCTDRSTVNARYFVRLVEGEIGGGLSDDYVAALGKATVAGYARNGPSPTMFDPATELWDDGSFLSIFRISDPANPSQEWTWGIEDGAANLARLNQATNASLRVSTYLLETDSDSGDEYVIANTNAQINRDGSGRSAYYHVESDLGGEANIWADDDGSYVLVKANAGQTEPVLVLKDADDNVVFSVGPDGTVGP